MLLLFYWNKNWLGVAITVNTRNRENINVQALRYDNFREMPMAENIVSHFQLLLNK